MGDDVEEEKELAKGSVMKKVLLSISHLPHEIGLGRLGVYY